MGDINLGNGPAPHVEHTAIRSYGRQAAATVLGIATLAAGGAATFISSNGAGSAGLVAGGVALLLFVLLGERLEFLKVGNVEFHLREAARQLTQQAARLEAQGDVEAAERLRAEARRLLLHASPAARAYEELRRTRPPGALRIIELSRIVEDAREYSDNERPPAEAVCEIFFSGGDGERVYALALMQEDPTVGDIDCILDSVLHSRSAFEQGQALRAALQLRQRLNAADKARLIEAVQQQLGPGGHIGQSTHRRRLASQILSMLDE
jgi:hypothetical protein